jgi:hypothetical protein
MNVHGEICESWYASNMSINRILFLSFYAEKGEKIKFKGEVYNGDICTWLCRCAVAGYQSNFVSKLANERKFNFHRILFDLIEVELIKRRTFGEL